MLVLTSRQFTLPHRGVLGGKKGFGASPWLFSWKHVEHMNFCQEERLAGLRENCWTTELPEFLRTPLLHVSRPASNPVATLDSGVNIQAHFLNAQVVGFLELH